MLLKPTCPTPPPPRIYRFQGSGFRPDIPRASLNRHTPGSPGGSPEVLGCSVGTSGSRARRANPHPHPSPSQAAAKLPFVSHCSRLLQSHGHVALPARGCSRLHARARRRPRSGPACGLLAASPTQSPLSLLGPWPAKQLSSGSQSLWRPLSQAPSCSVQPSLVLHPGLSPGLFPLLYYSVKCLPPETLESN